MAKLFSIKQKFSDQIYSKKKKVEFRRQNVNVKENEFCLIYTSSPVKKVTGYFIVKKKIRLSINKLWNLTKKIAGITKKEFLNYFDGCKTGTAIIFKKIKKFQETMSLDELRKKSNFRPPQSYCNIDEILIKLFNKLLPQQQLNQFFNSNE